jgi:broad specificity phosphatase PhoE
MPPDGDSLARDILICRHGETDWNRGRRIMGSLDVPLSEAGRRQCAGVGALLQRFGVRRIVSSPLARAAESARIIAGALGLEVSQDPDLEEVRFGRWQGKTYAEVLDDPEFHRFLADPVANRTAGGETIVDVQSRGLAAFARATPGERTLFVSHGDIIRSTLCHYLDMPIIRYRRIRVDNCGLSAVVEVEGRVDVRFVNLLPDPERAWDDVHWTRPS